MPVRPSGIVGKLDSRPEVTVRKPGWYTKAQHDAAVAAVIYGREMMRKRGRAPGVFLDAFAALGGISIPGEPTATPIKRRIALRAAEMLARAQGGGEGKPLEGAAESSARREAMRAVTEAQWAAFDGSNEVLFFRVEFAGRVADEAGCVEFLEGCRDCVTPGYWWKSAVAVLPACFDGARFRPVYEYEIKPETPIVDRVPDADAATLEALAKALMRK